MYTFVIPDAPALLALMRATGRTDAQARTTPATALITLL